MYGRLSMNSARFKIPPINTLIAFEAAARLGSITRAAEELGTSSAAISRYIVRMESLLSASLFERKSRGISLTAGGGKYFSTVQSSLQALRAASHELRLLETTLTIGCTVEIAVMLLLPIHSRLREGLGEGVSLRVLNCDYDMLHLLLPTGVDLMFEYSASDLGENASKLMEEEVVPVASPSFFRKFETQLSKHPRSWMDVPRLDVVSREVKWATWATWFGSYDCDPPPAPVERFENYIYLMEAAVSGEGIALGWNGFVNRYFETGRLVPLKEEWCRTGIGLYSVLTPRGRDIPNARQLQKELTAQTRQLHVGPELLKSAGDRWAARAAAC